MSAETPNKERRVTQIKNKWVIAGIICESIRILSSKVGHLIILNHFLLVAIDQYVWLVFQNFVFPMIERSTASSLLLSKQGNAVPL